MLTGKQRSYLKGIANGLKPIMQLGKEGITPAFIAQVNETIEKRELIKITILESCDLSTQDAATAVANYTHSEFVQAIGRKIVIYKRNRKEPVIELPRSGKK